MNLLTSSWLQDAMQWASDSTYGLWVWSWEALILLACVWVWLKLLRVQSPALRHHVWLLGLLMVAILPFGAKLARSLPEPRPQPWRGETLRYVAELPDIVLLPLQAPAPPLSANADAPIIQPAAKRSFPFSTLLFCAWLLGACVMFVSLLRNLWRMRRVRQSAVPVTAAALGCTARLAEAIPLRLSNAIHSPVLLGVARPLILLPHDVTEWTTAAERSAMIEHELAHVARRDHYTNLLLNALNHPRNFFFLYIRVGWTGADLLLNTHK